MKKKPILDLYSLTPLEFEQLIVTLLSETGFTDLKVTDGPGDRGVDILGLKGDQKVAIQVKHKRELSLSELQCFTDKYFSDPLPPRSLIYVTSAKIPQGAEKISENLPKGCSLKFLDQKDIYQMLSQQQVASSRFFRNAMQRLRTEKIHFIFGTVTACCSLLGVFLSLYPFTSFEKAPLNKRINTVERALTNIRDLESYLIDIKKDMAETEKATQIINEKNNKAKELEKLTEFQLDALKNTLQAESWQRTLFNYLLGFIFGIASSFIASVMHAKWIQRKALK